MKSVIAYGIRHGEKEGNTLTELGYRQVQASAKKYLLGFRPVLALDSARLEARLTVAAALQAIGATSVPLRFEQGFAFSMAEKECLPGPSVLDWYYNPPKPIETVQDWLHCPEACVLRGQVAISLIHVARDLADGDVFIIGSHSPVIEMAVPQPANFSRLNLADMVRYTIEIDHNHGRIVSAEYLKAPQPQETSVT